jgi:uncharacterized protein (DUF433 family)
MVTKTGYEHIVLDDGIPVISGTTMKIEELIVEKKAYCWSPEEIHFQHPYLSLGQIHSALAYYWDHAAEIDEDIERRLRRIKQLEESSRPLPLTSRLRSQGII